MSIFFQGSMFQLDGFVLIIVQIYSAVLDTCLNILCSFKLVFKVDQNASLKYVLNFKL